MLLPEEKENLEKFVQHMRSAEHPGVAFLGGYISGLVLKLDRENTALRQEMFPENESVAVIVHDQIKVDTIARRMLNVANSLYDYAGTVSRGNELEAVANCLLSDSNYLRNMSEALKAALTPAPAAAPGQPVIGIGTPSDGDPNSPLAG